VGFDVQGLSMVCANCFEGGHNTGEPNWVCTLDWRLQQLVCRCEM